MSASIVSAGGRIAAPDAAIAELARARQSELIKPRGSLGRLEEIACWFAARQRRIVPDPIVPAIVVFAADHGVARHGVSAYPSSVTAHVVRAIAGGSAAISVLARAIDARLTIVDVGVAEPTTLPNVCNERIAPGTADLFREAAMSEAQLLRALAIGANHARAEIAEHCTLLIGGEVGIANTTSAACLIANSLGIEPQLIVGRGSGIDDQVLVRKVSTVRRALARAGAAEDPLRALRELGGFEIAALTGFYLEGARCGVPCLLDGYISTAAALIACRIDPGVRDWLLASHRSSEGGHAAALEHLELEPLVSFDMRLGEGTGAALVVPLLRSALQLHAQMATFAQAGVPDRV